MVRSGKEGNGAAVAQTNPETEERRRLNRLAISKNLLSEAPVKVCSVPLSPSKTVTKHHGKDILRKSNRKNRFLFSFPGLLAPISGGKLGELKDLGSKNPILYLDFPQGQMKLFGTIIYPKNRYLTLQFSRGGKNVVCEDYFDTMIVFSDAWWIGRKEENPKEVRLEFPEDLNVGQQGDYDFKGGAGSTCERMQGVNGNGMTLVKQQSPKRELEDDLSDSEYDLRDLIQAPPTRHSARTSGRTFKYAETSSADDETSEGEENEVGLGSSTRNHASGKTECSFPVVFNIDNKEQLPQSVVTATKMKDISCNNRSSRVQSTISTLFKKVEEKKGPEKLKYSPSSTVSDKILQETDSEEKIDQDKVRDDVSDEEWGA